MPLVSTAGRLSMDVDGHAVLYSLICASVGFEPLCCQGFWVLNSVGRVPALQAGCQEFDSPRIHGGWQQDCHSRWVVVPCLTSVQG
jgi:hypothetical protein